MFIIKGGVFISNTHKTQGNSIDDWTKTMVYKEGKIVSSGQDETLKLIGWRRVEQSIMLGRILVIIIDNILTCLNDH